MDAGVLLRLKICCDFDVGHFRSLSFGNSNIQMHNLSKSKLLAFRQCPKRLWLEVHRPDLKEEPPAADDRFDTANEVGVVARRIYDPDGKGTLIDVKAEGFKHALTRSAALLQSSAPIFEAGFIAEGALAFADIMLPVRDKSEQSWRVVEVKFIVTTSRFRRSLRWQPACR
jgi:hypothetical protein